MAGMINLGNFCFRKDGYSGIKMLGRYRKQEGGDNTMPLAGDEDYGCLRDKKTGDITRINYTFYSIYGQYNTRKRGYRVPCGS